MTRGPAKQFDRDEVLGKALELFWAQGYEATGMSQLQSHLGVGRQSLYNTFGNKMNLYLEALRNYFEDRYSLSRDVLSQPGLVLDNLGILFQTMFELIQESDHCGCFVGNSLAEFGGSNAEMREILTGFLNRLEKLFVQNLKRAQYAGEISQDASPEALGKLLLISSQGFALMSKLEDDPNSVKNAAFTLLNMIRQS